MRSLAIVGDALLDRDLAGRAERLMPDAPAPVVSAVASRPRAGGAGLAATLAARSLRVRLVCALGDDAAGDELRGLLERAGVELIDLGLDGATPEKVRVLADGHPLARLDSGGDGAVLRELPDGALDDADAVLVSDYGRGVAALPSVRAALARVRVPLVWDPHPRGPAPLPGATLVTPNLREALAFAAAASDPAEGGAAAERAARTLRSRWRAVAVAVTLGERGALLVAGDEPPLRLPALPASGDPCGAGDCFAATAAARLAAGALPSEAVAAAVDAASAFVAGERPTPAGGARGAGPRVGGVAAVALAERVRRAGGTVVATGGCFDLLHAGHVRMLERARALGDCLIVCLNSDSSVARLKGGGRPVVGQEDRAAVLAGLACVDAVIVFDEDDPRAALRRLRPHFWVKGGDYAAGALPERATLAEWGGQTVLVPYVAGRSTTRLIEEVLARVR